MGLKRYVFGAYVAAVKFAPYMGLKSKSKIASLEKR